MNSLEELEAPILSVYFQSLLWFTVRLMNRSSKFLGPTILCSCYDVWPLSWRGWLKICGPSRTKCKIGITAPEIKDDRRIEDDPPFVLQEFLIVTVDICWYCCCCLWCLWTGGCSGSCSFVCFTAFEVGIVPIKQSNIFFKHDLKHVEN